MSANRVAAAVADGVAATHLVAVAFLVTGGPLSRRWPRLARAHVPVALAIGAVSAAGADCPLTTLELQLRAWAGRPAYANGFLAHYLVEPVHSAGITPRVRLAIYATAITPNALAYGGRLGRLARRAGRRAGHPTDRTGLT